jgi:hypothetical protein
VTKPSIYLCGPISGLTVGEAAGGWRVAFARQIDHQAPGLIDLYSPLRHKGRLAEIGVIAEKAGGTSYCNSDGTDQHDPMLTERAIIAKDRLDCRRSSMIVAGFLGATTKSTGSLIEFGWADAWNIPILLIMEKPEGMRSASGVPHDNPHEHLFVTGIASWRTDNIAEAAYMAKTLLLPGI